MGYAVDNYAVFDCIASGGVSRNNPSGRLAREVAELFDAFTVVAFVLHDPSVHTDFDQYLGQVFEQIDRQTGSDLLIFALTRPSTEWLTYARGKRPYHRRLDEALDAMRDSTQLGSLGVHALATRLGIPTSSLPVIILTQDLSDSGFTWVQTQPDQFVLGGGVCQQLERLGQIANDLAVGRRSYDLEAIRSALDVPACGQVRLDTSLAEAVCQAIAPATNRRDMQRMKSLLNDVRVKISAITKQHSGELPPEVEQRLMDLEVTLAYALRATQGHGDSNRAATPAALEPLSQELLTLAWDVLDLVVSRQDNLVDLSPVVMCVGKALETELNHSIVQWARAIAGVDMPEFFGKALPKARQRPVIELDAGYRVDLSARGRNPDSSIANLPAVIGVCIGLLAWAKRQCANDGSGMQDAAAIAGLEEWIDDLRKLRNKAAHPDRVTESVGRDALARATDDTVVQYWQALVRMKQALRGDG